MLTTAERKSIIQLHQKKFRDQRGEFIVEGEKGVLEVLQSSYKILDLIIEESHKGKFESIEALAIEQKISPTWCGKKDAALIKTTDTFPGVLAVVAKSTSHKKQDDRVILMLDAIADPGNLGTIIRSAHWFGITTIILSDHCVDPYNPKVVRASMGSLFHVDLVQPDFPEEFIKSYQDAGYHIVVLDANGKTPSKMSANKKSLYILGSESHGVRDSFATLADESVAIAGDGSAESLNVAVAAGILLYHVASR